MGVLAGFIALVAVGAAIIGIIVAIAFAARACLNWVLGPLDRAAKNRQFPIQFGLADLLCLFVLIQLSIGFLQWMSGDVEAVVVLDILLGVIVIVVWWKCVRTLSQAGIHGAWQRCFVLTLRSARRVRQQRRPGRSALFCSLFLRGPTTLHRRLAAGSRDNLAPYPLRPQPFHQGNRRCEQRYCVRKECRRNVVGWDKRSPFAGHALA